MLPSALGVEAAAAFRLRSLNIEAPVREPMTPGRETFPLNVSTVLDTQPTIVNRWIKT
jgi:hypothetical protein